MAHFPTTAVAHWDFPRSPAGVALLVDFGVEHGHTARELLRGTGLAPAQLGDVGTTVSARQELGVIGNLLRLLGERPGLGLQVGARYRVSTFGIFGFAFLASPTIGDAMSFALRFYDLSYGYLLPSLSVEDGLAVARFRLPEVTGPTARFLVERDLVAIRSVLTDALGGEMPFRSVGLTLDPAGADVAEYTRLLGVEPRFGAAVDVLTFDAALLDRPLPQANELTVAMCEQQCRAVVERHRSRTGIAARVRDQLVRVAGTPGTVGDVAGALGLSERTLRRRLAEAGTSYRALLDEVQYSLATELLGSGALSVDDVAVRLGYAEASSFIVAFKRWHGTTPAAFARAARR